MLSPKRGLLSRDPTYPEDPESWSESLTPPEGYWLDSPPYEETSLDTIQKVSGEFSIKSTVTKLFYYARASFIFHDPVDFIRLEDVELRFWHRLQPDKFSGTCWLSLLDVNGNAASKTFGTSSAGVWEPKAIPCGPSAYWAGVDPGFDWTKVERFEIAPLFKKAEDTGSHWIDYIYFQYERLVSSLTINSEPAGKLFTIDGYSGYTPGRLGLDPCVSYTVSIEAEDFVKWEDGSTDPTRTIHLVEGEEKTITAYYVGAPPPPPEIPTWLLPLLFFGTIGAILIFVAKIE